MTINKVVNNDEIVVSVEGWLDVETTPELTDYMSKLESSDKLVFDFENLEYISSSGVREVVSAYKRQRDSGGEFKVINVNEEVMDVFSMTRLDQKINIIKK